MIKVKTTQQTCFIDHICQQINLIIASRNTADHERNIQIHILVLAIYLWDTKSPFGFF